MSTAMAATGLTADEFAHLPDTRGFELVNGELAEVPVSVPAGITTVRILMFAAPWCESRNLGIWLPPDTGIRCFADDPNRVRKPDACFIRHERLTPAARHAPFLPIAPDLAVEVISPTDLAHAIDEKIQEYLDAGIPIVWIINPEARVARIHRRESVTGLYETDDLEAEPVLPGFRCKLADVLPAR
jgi:Uma2 family endonuclease